MNKCGVCGKEISSGDFCDECRDEIITDLEDLEIQMPVERNPSTDEPENN